MLERIDHSNPAAGSLEGMPRVGVDAEGPARGARVDRRASRPDP
ncbi:hypothetical protein [Actinomadura spongiicola]|nr:hypothetical protein [Actinomadura spongiicola]